MARAPLTHRRLSLLVGLAVMGLGDIEGMDDWEIKEQYRDYPGFDPHELWVAVDALKDLRDSKQPRRKDTR